MRLLKERLYRDQIDGTAYFRATLVAAARGAQVVLDLGCGAGNVRTDVRGDVEIVIGCDLDAAVGRNATVHHRVKADGYRLPFGDGTFDLVSMDFVIEHLADPIAFFREVRRVLRLGGRLVFRTPNRLHYVAIIASATPHWFHELVANRSRGLAASGGVWPTYYRANTTRRITAALEAAGLGAIKLEMIEREPSYLAFAAPAFALGILYERVVNSTERLARFRSNIFGVAVKI